MSCKRPTYKAAWVQGPFSLQGEYMHADYDAPAVGDPSFSGYYAYGSYFITGESRAYKQSSGAFDKVKPKKNFGLGEKRVSFRQIIRSAGKE